MTIQSDIMVRSFTFEVDNLNNLSFDIVGNHRHGSRR